MKKSISWFFFLLVVGTIVGAGVFLATWDFPAPVTKIEKVISNDRFPR